LFAVRPSRIRVSSTIAALVAAASPVRAAPSALANQVCASGKRKRVDCGVSAAAAFQSPRSSA
jgi:hypothetical protein